SQAPRSIARPRRLGCRSSGTTEQRTPAMTHDSLSTLRMRIAAGHTSHQALVEDALAGAAAPAAQHVFTRLYAQAALAAAHHADAALKAGVQLPALAGLPVSIKDLYDVAGETTMAGSVVRRGAAPAAHDSVAVQRLRAQGAAIVGKTN